MMSSREVMARAIRFEGADRMPYTLPEPYGSDMATVIMDPWVDRRLGKGVDEWGAVGDNVGDSTRGEVREFPLKEWAQWDRMRVPDIRDPKRWAAVEGARERATDLYLEGVGVSLYERIHFIRGIENTWLDIHESPDDLGRLFDLLVDMNLYAIERYAAAGVEQFELFDDWGLQDRLMISPASWRALWKPRYARVFAAAHEAGLLTELHSCGHIVDILDDLIEIGLDVIQMDQQENMGLELLGERFAGRITFHCPVDIQAVMPIADVDEIRRYCRKMAATLGRPEGGFIASHYGDEKGVGHQREAVDAMCDEFLKTSREHASATGADKT